MRDAWQTQDQMKVCLSLDLSTHMILESLEIR